MKIAAKTDIGNQRSENQDNYRAGREQDDTVWALVCDGMGGARGGKLASSVAAAHIEREFAGHLSAKMSSAQLRVFMHETIQSANALIFKAAQKDPSMMGMGTTLVCAVIQNGFLHYAHVGDSRVYLYEAHVGAPHTLTLLTRDHSMVQELVEQGSITEQEAFVHPHKNLITRALGVGDTVDIDYNERRVAVGDLVLLCSDGLTNYVSNGEMVRIMDTVPFWQRADILVDRALANGGQDNITAVLVEIEAAQEQTVQ
ncbi:MAG: Stp1/IreP family PP2C-type Ser/Thr phosphatase [Oscillospiraceae bacterium]|nr:Stp1/IreP family PP2C-type Ser/Thr phosphatase [Oscillospiraceae bacterium]